LKTLFWLMVIPAAAALLCGVAGAAPSHLGPTGVVATPTADVIGAQQFDVAVDYVRWKNFGERVTSWPVRVVAGLSDRVEVGVGYTSWKDSGPTMKIVPVNAKALIVPESGNSPAIAVGAAYGVFKDAQLLNPLFTGDVKVTTVYAVATKTLSKAEGDEEVGVKGTMRGSLGVMYNRYRDSTDGSATKPFVSLDYTTPNGKTTVAAEYKLKERISGLKERALSSVVLRHMFSGNVWAQVGVTNAWYTTAHPDCGKHEWFVGVGYHWTPAAREEYY
jgi:hypothetical protein